MRIKKMYADASLPIRGSDDAAGYDLFAYVTPRENSPDKNREVSLSPNETVVLGCGLAMEIPKGYVGLIFARSGLGIEKQLAPPNAVSVIDADYRGEVKLPIKNNGVDAQWILHGDRIGQLVVVPFLDFEIEEADELSETKRGTRGLGSTGV
jgi:dUTP pyrophosphatase